MTWIRTKEKKPISRYESILRFDETIIKKKNQMTDN